MLVSDASFTSCIGHNQGMGWDGACMMDQRIIRPDCCTFTARRSSAIFEEWHILEAWNIRIDMWPTLWVEDSKWWTDCYKGSHFSTS